MTRALNADDDLRVLELQEVDKWSDAMWRQVRQADARALLDSGVVLTTEGTP